MEQQRDMRVFGLRALDTQAHTFEFIANSGQVDRVGEVLDPNGCRFENWMKNPIILWAHDDWGLPVGKGLEIGVDATEGLIGKGMWASQHSDFAAMIEELFNAGFLNGFSVRFMAYTWEDFSQGSEEFKSGIWRIYTDWELLELSVVDIPCDPRALRKAYDAGQQSELRTMIRKATDLRPDKRSSQLDLLGGRSFASSRQVPAVTSTGVVPYRKFALAGEDTCWEFTAADGDALVEKGGWELYGQCHAWKDAGVDRETKAAYRLPVQKMVNGEVKTVWKGVAAAMARLLGSAIIPEDDRRAVYNRLAKHYAEFEKPVPELRQYGPTDAVVAAFGIDGIGELMRTLEPYIRKGVEFDLDADGLLEVLEGRYDEAGGKSAPDAADNQIFGPEIDEKLLEVLQAMKRRYGSTGENPNPNAV